ncbi:MAG: DUF354 domain-containing protein [Nitrosopumilaceae archaeon]|nr:DUF354 domain-containing protein [Nitrosopumilaceae archaeon]
MRVWLDALTPKQLLFSEYIMRRGSGTHTFLFTSRRYREVETLARIRGLKPTYVGRFGGGELAAKLDASLERAALLSGMVQEFGPDVSVSFCSPEAARISFGLAVPHIAFCNSPHAEAACRLSIPLCARLLIPRHIPKSAVSAYGLDASRITQYGALDEAAIIKNPPVPWDPETAGIRPGRPTILLRTYETQASYIHRATDVGAIIAALAEHFPRHNLVVSGRYPHQIRDLRDSHNTRCIVLEGTVDGGTLLGRCVLFVGSGGTMTTEAVLRGIRTISYQAVPTLGESYLVDQGAMRRARTSDDIVREAERLLGIDAAVFQERAARMLAGMEDPYNILDEQMAAI